MKDVVSLGFEEALRLTMAEIKPLSSEDVTLIDSVGRVVASDLYSLVDCPSIDASLKDGYAVLCRDLTGARSGNPVKLKISGSVPAGSEKNIGIEPGRALRVLTGAPIPSGADAVVAEEAVKREGDGLFVEIPVGPGTNILPRGRDVSLHKSIIRAGREISPGLAGLLAAGGHNLVPVFRNPVVGIIGTGDEIIEPGEPLAEGRLYASNITTLAGWCTRYEMETRMAVVKDNHEDIFRAIETLSEETDVLLTSGGAWTGERDIVAQVFEALGWRKVFHRVRMGPGKAVGFGLLEGKPVFVLPGGPPSNLMAFLQIALPGLLTLAGHARTGLPAINVRLASALEGRELDWADFFFGTIEDSEGMPVFKPLEYRSRLSSIAEATAVAAIPEGKDRLPGASIIRVQLLD